MIHYEESTGRKAFVNTLVTTILSPLSLLVGFYLGHALQKPHLSIVDLDHSYYSESHKLSDKLRSELGSQPLIVASLRDVLTRTALVRNNEPCVEWLDGEAWQDRNGDCINSVLEAAHGLAGSIVAEPLTPLPEALSTMRLSSGQRQSMSAVLQNLIVELTSFQTDDSTPRTGDVSFDVGILNTGDFDGVVSKYGKLTYSGGSFSIDAEKYVVVKAHGFETVHLAIGEVLPPEQQALKAWQKLVKSHEESQFELHLESGDKKPLVWKAHLFK